MMRLAICAVIALLFASACEGIFGPTPRPWVVESTANTERSTPDDFFERCYYRALEDGEKRLGKIGFFAISSDPEVEFEIDKCRTLSQTMEAEIVAENAQAAATRTPTAAAPARTPEPTGIPPDDDAPIATVVPTVTPEPTEVRCDSGLVSVAPLVAQTIDRANAISYAAAEQATSLEDQVRRSRNALNEISVLWSALGQGRGERVQRLVDGVGAAWKWGTNIEAANPKGFERHLTGIADAYGELAEALDECDELSSSVDRLRREVRDINLLIAELN